MYDMYDIFFTIIIILGLYMLGISIARNCG
jgi:hypothetical protein